MKPGIIYHSYSGKTRSIAEKIGSALSGSIIEVVPVHPYSALGLVTGCYRALKGISDQVKPDQIDLPEADCIILCSPVWAGRSTPVINGAVDGLVGGVGKKVFILVTCNDRKSGETAVSSLASRCKKQGLVISGSAVFDKNQVHDENAISAVINQIRNSGAES